MKLDSEINTGLIHTQTCTQKYVGILSHQRYQTISLNG